MRTSLFTNGRTDATREHATPLVGSRYLQRILGSRRSQCCVQPLVLALFLTSILALAQPQTAFGDKGDTAKSSQGKDEAGVILERAVSHSNSDSLIYQAKTELLSIRTKYPTSPYAVLALYHLGRTYHRMFYVEEYRQGDSNADTGLLLKASDYFNQYAKEQRATFFADAKFERALILLRLNRRSEAIGELEKLIPGGSEAKRDPYIYLYAMPWSTSGSPKEIISYAFFAWELAKVTLEVINGRQDGLFEPLADAIRKRAQQLAADRGR